MRIIAGEFRGRRLHSPKNSRIRPTVDRVREAVFSVIARHLKGANVLDLYAGTGALGLEALSRGAAQAVFIDESRRSVRLIHENVRLCGVQDRAKVIHGRVDKIVRRLAGQLSEEELFHLLFMDPPYGKGLVEKTMVCLDSVAHDDALVIAEHHVKDMAPESISPWVLVRRKHYGETVVSFYRKDLPAS